MNTAFLAQGLDNWYTRVLLRNAADFKLLDDLICFSGCNVTAPFKADMGRLADRQAKEVHETQASNTLVKQSDGGWSAFNTDVYGSVKPFFDRWKSMTGKRMLVIGAGGAARAAIAGLREQGARVSVVNRTETKAFGLAKEFGIEVLGYDQLNEKIRKFDGMINTVSVVIPPLENYSPAKDQYLLDANYSVSPFKKYFPDGDPRYINGKEWLIAQAEKAFFHFTGIEPAGNQFNRALTDSSVDKKGRIALIGPMGAGKSTVGLKLSEATGYAFIDMDAEIEKQQGMTIAEIFAKKGEAFFRKLEVELLAQIGREENIVISCGGGVVLYPENRRILSDLHTILLLVSPQTTVFREVKGQRPLLDGKDPVLSARKIFQSRLDYYLKCAHVLVNAEAGTPETIAELIYNDFMATWYS